MRHSKAINQFAPGYSRTAAITRDVHVWGVRTDPFASPERLSELAELLSDDERKRAERLRTEILTERFVVSHALVRHILGIYLRRPPQDLDISVDGRGRPYLSEHPEIDFNLSHTEGMSVIAVRLGNVGVDIERVRDDIDATAVARRVFSKRECSTIAENIAASRTPFFEYWTIKEAYAKAIGLGVRIEFRNIDVSLGEPMTVALHDVYDDSQNWDFELHGCRDFRIAVAARRVRAEGVRILFFEADGNFDSQGELATELLGSTNVSPTWREENCEQSRLQMIGRA